ncbi:phosphotransferase [Marinomonas gallaica]|uniref:phosphotransferase n=1 Tax=Marinomonas gallaica TaxID=1806667 RepID=UPI003CE44C4A
MCPLSKYLKQMNSILPEQGDLKVSELDEGFSNHTYHVHWPYHLGIVVRISALNDVAFCVNRSAELEIWQKAAEYGLTARVLWKNERNVVASEFLDGTTYSWEVEHTTLTLEPICQAMRALHCITAVSHEYDVYALMASWLDHIEHHPNHHEIKDLYQQASVFFQTLTMPVRPKRLSVCHNDLNPKNMLVKDGEVRLIDWECAGMNDPLFDFAVLVHAHHLNDAQIKQAYLIIFEAKLDAQHSAIITQYRQAYVLRELIWLLLKHLVSGIQDLDCLQWYHALLTDPVFNPYFTAE